MTLLDAQPYDTAKARRRNIKIAATVVVVVVLAALAWMYRNWPEERCVNKFFAALEHQNYEVAYGIYFNDPTWIQHRQKYSQYTYADFYRDWGPGGEWGLVKSYRIYGSANTKGLASGGVVVEVVVNERSEHARMFVQKSDKTLTVYPF
jgi:uridine phosphorylase